MIILAVENVHPPEKTASESFLMDFDQKKVGEKNAKFILLFKSVPSSVREWGR